MAMTETEEAAIPDKDVEEIGRLYRRATGGHDDKLFEKRNQVWQARRHGKICGHCGRTLGAREPIWRIRLSYLTSSFFAALGLWHNSNLTPVCQECREKMVREKRILAAPDYHSRYYPKWPSAPCENCGRLVYETEFRRRRHHAYCCERCADQKGPIYQQAKARQRRAEARGPSRPCLECGEHFEPRRADALFCSVTCKQKAYRKRVTINKCNGILPI